MAGLLYLPRIFVYHSEATHESQKNVFKTMERKLYNFIMMPAMLLSWLFGVLLIHSLGFEVFTELWMQIKTISVIILTYYHFLLGKYLNDFAINDNKKSSKFYRIINEVPTIILIVVVFVVVFKPLY
jgi:putative membrane protein